MKYNKTLVFIAACIGMVFFGVAFLVMGAVLPSLSEAYSLSAIETSSLVSLLPVGVLIGSVFFGAIVDRFGYKLLLIISTFLTLLGIEGLAFLDNLNLLRACIFLIGLGGGLLNGSTNALASDVSTDEERGAKLSILGVCYGVGALGIPLLVGVLSKTHEYPFILQWTGVVMLLAIIYFFALRFPESKIKQGFPFKKAVSLFKEPLLLLASFFLFLHSGIEGLINNWATSFLNDRSAEGDQDVVISLTFFVAGITASRLLLTYLTRVMKHEYLLIVGIVIAFCGIALLNFTSGLQIASVSLFITGFGMGAGFPIMISYIGTAFKDMSGTAIGFAMVIALTGNTLMNVVMGFVSDTFALTSLPIFILILLAAQGILLASSIKQLKKVY